MTHRWLKRRADHIQGCIFTREEILCILLIKLMLLKWSWFCVVVFLGVIHYATILIYLFWSWETG